MDGIERAYCLQSLYYNYFFDYVYEYMDNADIFQIKEVTGAYHVPTWRADLLPSSFFDLVICVQVLPEIPEVLLKYIIDVFARVMKQGAALYIRDHEEAWKPVYALNVEKLLIAKGFILEFRPFVNDTRLCIDSADIHGIPRIWRKK